MLIRYDTGSLRSPRRLDNGRMIVEGVLTRSGVFNYTMPDGSIRREYRPPSEVFKKDSMDTFQMLPITDDHPEVGYVTAANAKELSVGMTGENVRKDGEYMIGPLAINDADAITKLGAGKVALSCGYNLDLDETPGVTPEGERYDAVQRNIKGNHVALVDVARAGPAARIRMDGAAWMLDNQTPTPQQIRNDAMDPLLLEAINAKAELTVKLAAATARADAAELKLADAEAAKTRAEAERDSEKSRADAAEKSRNDGADITERVEARVELVKAAADVMGAEYDAKGKDDHAVRMDLLEKLEPDFKPSDEQKADYVSIRLDSALRYFKLNASPYKGMARVDESARADAGDSEEAAKKRKEERDRNAWNTDSADKE